MQKNILSLLTLLLFLTANIKAEGGDGLFPPFDGYKLKTDFPVYTPDNLWDYINGGAYTYLNFKFTDLHIAEYTKGDILIKAEIYRHENNVYAFGMYAQERAPDYSFIDIGVQGYAENTLVNFVKGPYYVKIICYDGNETIKQDLLSLARSIEKELKGTDKLPEMFSKFPEKEKVKNSEAYIATEFLGYNFMPGVYVTTYKHEEKNLKLFIAECESEAQAEEVVKKLTEKSESSKKKKNILTIRDKYNGTILLYLKGRLIYGCMDNCDTDLFKSFTGK